MPRQQKKGTKVLIKTMTMTRKDLFKIIRPIILYLIVIAASFGLRIVTAMPVLIFSFLVAAAAPIVLLLWNVQHIRTQKQKVSGYFVFGLYAVPGVLFGVQLILDLALMLHGYIPNDLIFSSVLFGLVGGLIFGFTGKLLQHWLDRNIEGNIIRKLIIMVLLGAVFGALLFYGAIYFTYSNAIPSYGLLLNTVLFPKLIGGLLCDLMDDHTFGCVSVNFYVFPFVYAIIVPLLYLVLLGFKKKLKD